MRKSARMHFKFFIMATDSQLIDAFSRGLQIKEEELKNAERLLLRAATLLEEHDNIANIKYASAALVNEIKVQLKIPTV